MGAEDVQNKRKGFEDLTAWRAAMALVEDVYRLASALPKSETYELARQIRRSAVSIPSNIAEGRSSGSDGLFLRHVRIANGSVGELETQLRLIDRLNLLPSPVPPALRKRLERVAQLTRGLQNWLEDKG